MTVQEVLGLLEGVRRGTNGTYRARCPAHDDRRPSLSVAAGEEDRVLLHCHGGCTVDDIVAALGLSLQDLFSEEPKQRTRRRPVAKHDYRDESGALRFQVGRFEPKAFRQRQPDGKGGWTNNVQGVRRLLYRLPELIANRDHTVFIVEGEKDADRLAQLGLVATCNPGGAGKWRAEYTRFFKSRDVVVLPDNDHPGRKHAESVAAALHKVAATVRLVTLPDLPDKGDVSDWLDAGGDAAQLQALVEVAPLWSPPAETSRQHIEDSEDSEWEPPIPFHTPELPEFPIHVLPDWMEEFSSALAVFLQVPADMPALLCLSAVAIAVAGRLSVVVREGFEVPLNLYLAIVMDPANRKSAALSRAMAPVERFEREQCKALGPEIARKQAEHDTLAKTLAQAQMGATKARGNKRHQLQREVMQLAEELADKPRPVMPRLLADDVTPEKVASLLAEQGGRLAIVSAEGGVFEQMSGRYSSNVPNLDPYLKGWDGEPLRIDRVTRSPDFVRNPCLSIVLTVQPDVLRPRKPGLSFRDRKGS